MLNYLLNNGSIQDFIVQLLLTLPVILLILSVHETAHGYVACKLGDPTAQSLGRLTLNPLKHVDLFGFLSMVLFGFGWAKPVPVNARYFKNPKRDMALTGIAGPISNLLMALGFAALLKVFSLAFAGVYFTNAILLNMATYFLNFLFYGVYLNVSFAVFNLLPIPPFDGSRLLFAVLPSHLYFKIMRYERYIYLIVLVALILGVLDPLLNFLTGNLTNLIFRLFSL